MFLGRISAETRLKIHNFGNKTPKSPSAGGSIPQDTISIQLLENVQDPTTLTSLVDADS